MNYEEILRKIIRKYGVMTENIRTAQLIESKLAKRTATYADAEKFAQDIGGILTDVFREYLPEALTDGRLYRAAAEVLVQQPMVVASNDVADVAIRIQQELNENAGIGMNAIDPGLNQDQIDGIITGICNAESYDSSVELFMDQVAGFFEGEVDDFVRENADFQYKAGLSPTIERKISGKCCAWCAKLAGTYPYEDVRDRGNDVFRRHNNCHCQILYNPADGSKKRQNAHTKSWTDEGKADRIAFAKRAQAKEGFRSSADPMAEVTGSGETSHPEEIRKFREEAVKNGVEIIEHEYESWGYSPGLKPGQPGQLYVSKGASYSGWRHEIEHMRDDKAAGWSGMAILMDKDECYRREANAYNIEIRLANEAGRPDIAERLRENLKAERRSIYGSD